MAATPNWWGATLLLIFSQILLWTTLIKVVPYFKLPFAPSIGAFTFPVAISAMGLNRYNALVPIAPSWQGFMHGLDAVEIAITAGIVLMVAIRFAGYLVKLAKQPA